MIQYYIVLRYDSRPKRSQGIYFACVAWLFAQEPWYLYEKHLPSTWHKQMPLQGCIRQQNLTLHLLRRNGRNAKQKECGSASTIPSSTLLNRQIVLLRSNADLAPAACQMPKSEGVPKPLDMIGGIDLTFCNSNHHVLRLGSIFCCSKPSKRTGTSRIVSLVENKQTYNAAK